MSLFGKKKENKSIPCYFIQTGAGNVVIRLYDKSMGSGSALTLHQILALGIPVNDIPHFDPVAFKQFYGGDGLCKKNVYNYVVEHGKDEKEYLEFLK